MEMKIGQEITFKNDFKIETMIRKDVFQIKEGDKALVTSYGLKILTGKARGKITSYAENDKVKGIDYRNISKLILKRLNITFGVNDLFEDEGIDLEMFIDEIEDVLMDIL